CWSTRRRPIRTTSPRSTAACRRCSPNRAWITRLRRPAARAARPARACRPGSGSSRRRTTVAISSSAPSTLPDGHLVPTCALARGCADLAEHFAIRRSVFVDAQRLFELDDRDARDEHPATLHAV